MNRRALLIGAVTSLAMPSIVRAAALMRVPGDVYHLWASKMPILPALPLFDNSPSIDWTLYHGPNGRLYEGTWTFFSKKGRESIYDSQVSFSKREYDANGDRV